MPKKPLKKLYRFTPQTAQIAADQKRIQHLLVERAVVKDVVKGRTYEDIADKHNISMDEARRISKTAIAKWSGDLGHTATEARELSVKRLDAMLVKLDALVFPEPFIDNETGQTVVPAMDMAAAKLYLDIIQYQGKLLGTEAAHKLEALKEEILRREYIGVKSNAQGVIDL